MSHDSSTLALEASLRAGSLASSGLLSATAITAAASLINKVNQSDCETVRVMFTDQHGIMRGKTIVASALASAFSAGLRVPSTLLLKDTSHRTVFSVWSEHSGAGLDPMNGAGDIVLVPDASTFKRLPWAPHSAWILCDSAYKDGEAIEFDPRTVLKRSLLKLDRLNLNLVVGLEVEFHVFELLDANREHVQTTMPGCAPKTRSLAHGYQFLTETRYAELEYLMDELRRYSQEMGLPVRSMEVEMGPSQFEFTFDPRSPLMHADNMIMFRTMVKEVCARKGLHATFMCRPKVENGSASGWHLHQSIIDATTGDNLFTPEAGQEPSPLALQWIAGLLKHASEACLLTTPTVNGYKRYQPYQLAPDRIQWGHDNRGAMIRALTKAGDSASRIENRVADTTANPYYYFASQIVCGLAGIEAKLCAPDAVETPYDSDATHLPENLGAAVEAFNNSELIRAQLGDQLVDYLVHIKRAEWRRYLSAISQWEQDEYFSLY
ncbi:MAG: glutamine synthetase family protein [Granulosicoccus sp.]